MLRSTQRVVIEIFPQLEAVLRSFDRLDSDRWCGLKLAEVDHPRARRALRLPPGTGRGLNGCSSGC